MSAPGMTVARQAVAEDEVAAGVLPQLLLTLICGGYAMGAVLGWGSPRLALFMGDFGLGAAAVAAAVSCLWYARSPACCFPTAWLLFALSSAMAGAGNVVWGWYEVVLRQPVPDTSLADFFFLLFAPPAIVGLLVLAKRPSNRAGWVCLALDTWLIGGSLITLSWSLALAHAAQWDGESVARAALSLAYPLLDIVLVSMVLVLHFRRTSANRSAINTAIAALALTVLCDALFSAPPLREHYRSGQLLDAGWFAGSILLAFAPWAAPRERAARERSPARTPRTAPPMGGSLGALTPYLAAAVCTLGVLYNVIDGNRIDRVVIFTACTVVLALVVRQGIMLLENIALAQELAHKENHFRSLVQGSSDVIMIAEPDGVLRYVSPAAAGVYGIDADDLVGAELASLIHPADLGAVVHEVRRFLAADPAGEPTTRIECRFRSGEGGWLNVESTVNRHHGGLIFNCRDVTERVRLQAQLRHSAEHDPLTDLPNRALFTERVRQALAGRRSSDVGLAVLFIDLDGFKAVNDSIGHQAGDELLVHAARRLQESVRAVDTAARLGGDEFAALILTGVQEGTAREYRIHEIADRLRATLSRPYRVSGADLRVTASIGVAFAEPGSTPTDLMRNADLAMYRAKASGKGRVELYAPQMQDEVVRRTQMTTRLRAALRDGEFALLHEPVVELGTGRISAVAAQARWRSAQGTLFTPDEFLRVADAPREDAGFGDLSRWVLEEAVQQAVARQRAGHPTPVAVRLPVGRLMDRAMPPREIEALLTRYGLASGSLVLELADSDPRAPLDELEQRLGALRRIGVRIALDGFGSGYAAISALRRLPADVMRIDRGLVEGVVESARIHKITAGLLRIATDLGMQSVAEGVDRPEQVSALRVMGCTHGRGKAFSGPLDEHRLRRILTRGGYPPPAPDSRGPGRGLKALPLRRRPELHSMRPEGRQAPPKRLPRQPATSDSADDRDPVAESVTLPPLRPNGETAVPPT